MQKAAGPSPGDPCSWPGGEPGDLLVTESQHQEWEVLNSHFEGRACSGVCAVGRGSGTGRGLEPRYRGGKIGVFLAERSPVWGAARCTQWREVLQGNTF